MTEKNLEIQKFFEESFFTLYSDVNDDDDDDDVKKIYLKLERCFHIAKMLILVDGRFTLK